MRSNYCFYIHHQGLGHLTRALMIAGSLGDSNIVFMGSNLSGYRARIPESIQTIDLPSDIPTEWDTRRHEKHVSFLHYAPLNIEGLTTRMGIIADYFRHHRHCLFIVDVSVEITLFARLLGIPTVVIRQHGRRTDMPHQLAYESAELIIAPYPKVMSRSDDEGIFDTKTLFSGGFSKYSHSVLERTTAKNNQIAIYFGQGGTSLNMALIERILSCVPEYHIHVLGLIDAVDWDSERITIHGISPNAERILHICDYVICNAGHNTLMELGDLRKKIICIPAERAFEEQVIKASYLRELGLAIVISEAEVPHVDWSSVLQQADEIDLNAWHLIMNNNATNEIAAALEDCFIDLFNS